MAAVGVPSTRLPAHPAVLDAALQCVALLAGIGEGAEDEHDDEARPQAQQGHHRYDP